MEETGKTPTDAERVRIAQVKLFSSDLLFSVAMENNYRSSAEQL